MEEMIFKHLPMEYNEVGDWTDRKVTIIGEGKIDGYNYKIKNMGGSYPTAYVKVPETHEFYDKHYNDIPIDAHGGLTYSQHEEDGFWIGWDYAHWQDYTPVCYKDAGKKWTTDEILEECRCVVEQLIRGVV